MNRKELKARIDYWNAKLEWLRANGAKPRAIEAVILARNETEKRLKGISK